MVSIMGTGFTIDSPLRVAKYGISSVISLVDEDKCSVCTLCREICDCLAIQPVSGPVAGLGHNVPRIVDPLLFYRAAGTIEVGLNRLANNSTSAIQAWKTS